MSTLNPSLHDLRQLCDDHGYKYDDVLARFLAHPASAPIPYVRDGVVSYLVTEQQATGIRDGQLDPELLIQPDDCDEAVPVFTTEEAAAELGLAKESFKWYLRRARGAKIPLPDVISFRMNGGAGRPRNGFTPQFMAAFRAWLEGLDKESAATAERATADVAPPETMETEVVYDGAGQPVAVKFAPAKPAPRADAPHLLGAADDTLQGLLNALARGGKSREELANLLDVSPRRLDGLLHELQLRGHRLSITSEDAAIDEVARPSDDFVRPAWDTRGSLYRLGIVSDVHACCYQTKILSLQAIYETFARRGCSLVVNAGDITHGTVNMHKEYKYDLALTKFEEQIGFLREFYPRVDGLETLMIAGNHDLSWMKDGIDFVEHLCATRNDLTYAGPINAFLEGPGGIPNFIMLYHPGDGTSYALSYKTQKIAEYVTYSLDNLVSADARDLKLPQIAVVGHYHKYVHHRGPDGGHYITAPASCGITGFQVAKHLINEMGALMFEFGIDDAGRIDEWSIRGYDVRGGGEVVYTRREKRRDRIFLTNHWKEVVRD